MIRQKIKYIYNKAVEKNGCIYIENISNRNNEIEYRFINQVNSLLAKTSIDPNFALLWLEHISLLYEYHYGLNCP